MFYHQTILRTCTLFLVRHGPAVEYAWYGSLLRRLMTFNCHLFRRSKSVGSDLEAPRASSEKYFSPVHVRLGYLSDLQNVAMYSLLWYASVIAIDSCHLWWEVARTTQPCCDRDEITRQQSRFLIASNFRGQTLSSSVHYPSHLLCYPVSGYQDSFQQSVSSKIFASNFSEATWPYSISLLETRSSWNPFRRHQDQFCCVRQTRLHQPC